MQILRNFPALYFSVVLCTVGYGISFPLLAINLETMGISGALFGVNAAMPALGWIIGSIWFVKLQSRFGIKPLLIALLLVAAFAMIAFSLTHEFWTWTALRFLFGGSLGLFFRGIEFCINDMSSTIKRGRNIGIYSFFFMFGLAIGATLQPTLGTDKGFVFYLVSAFLVATIIIISVGSFKPASNNGSQTGKMNWRLILIVPIAPLAVLTYGLYEDVPAYLLSVYSLRNGLSENIAALSLTAVAIGNMIFPIPLGMLSDRMGRYPIMLACSVGALALTICIPFTLENQIFFLGTIVVWSGLASSLYLLGLSLIGDHFKDTELASANITFGMFYAVGSLIGPLINGAALDTLNSHGLMVSVAAMFTLFIVIASSLLIARRAYE